MGEPGAGRGDPALELLGQIREGLVVADAAGRVVWANEAISALLGWSPHDLEGRPLTTLLPERLHDQAVEGHERIVRASTLAPLGRPVRTPALHKDGGEVEVDIVLSRVDRDGQVLVAATMRPVHAEPVDRPAVAMEAVRELLLSEPGFVDAKEEMVATLGRHLGCDLAALWIPDARIDRLRCAALWEAEANRFAGFCAQARHAVLDRGEGLPGRVWRDATPLWSAPAGGGELVREARAAGADVDSGVVFPVKAAGEVVGVVELLGLGTDEAGEAVAHGLARAGTDIGPVLQRRVADEAAREERARLALALRAGDLGVWSWDVHSGLVTWSDDLQRVVGRAGAFTGTVDDFLDLVHPDDRRAVSSAFVRALEPGRRSLHVEYRIVRPDGHVRWLESRGAVLDDGEGAAAAMTGVTVDVTRRKESERELEAQHARLDLALEATGMGVWSWDARADRSWSSLPLQLVLGFPRTGTLAEMVERIHSEDRERVVAEMQRTMERERTFTFDHRVVLDDGSVRWVAGRGVVLRDPAGEVAQLTGVAADVTDQRAGDLEARVAQARLTTALEAGRMGTWHWDLRSSQPVLSPGFTRALGLPDASKPLDLVDRIHPDDRERMWQHAAAAVDAGGVDAEYRMLADGGGIRWLHVRGRVVHDVDAEPVSITGVAVDVTEHKEARQRLARKGKLLATLEELGRAITSNLDRDETVQLVTDSATLLIGAEIGAFFYTEVEPAGRAHLRYAVSGAAREAFADFPVQRSTPLFGPIFRGEPAIRLDDVTTDPRYGAMAPHRGMPDAHPALRSYLAVPVVTGDGNVIGGLVFGHSEPAEFDEHDEALAEGIAAQAAIAVANARTYELARHEIEARQEALEERDAVARALQESLLPPNLPQVRGLELASVYRAGAEAVGGDFYDAFRITDRQWGVVIGDVCGKGPEAAALTALTRHTIRSAAAVERHPRDVLGFLNDAIVRDVTERFCSAVYGRFQVQRRGVVSARIAVGGHPPPLVLRRDGTVTPLLPTGMLLGVVDAPDLDEHEVTLEKGDCVVLYTDGVTEARGRGRAATFGIDRLVELVRSLPGRSPREVAETIQQAVEEFAHDGRPADDLAVLVVAATG